jgi:hypothetical protein
MSELEILSRYPDLLGKLRELGAGAPQYVGPEDTLFVYSRGSVTNLTIQVAGRMLVPSGEIIPFHFFHYPSSDRSTRGQTIHLREGYLLTLQVREMNMANPPRSCWLEVDLIRGELWGGSGTAVLFAGYVDNTRPLIWPPGMTEPGFSGMGRLRIVVGTDPAPGNQVLEVVPTAATWRLHSLILFLATSSAGTDRIVSLIIDDGIAHFFWGLPAGTQPPGTVMTYCAGGYSAPSTAGGNQIIGWPAQGLLLRSGSRIRTETQNMDAADNYAAPVMLVEEWITG